MKDVACKYQRILVHTQMVEVAPVPWPLDDWEIVNDIPAAGIRGLRYSEPKVPIIRFRGRNGSPRGQKYPSLPFGIESHLRIEDKLGNVEQTTQAKAF